MKLQPIKIGCNVNSPSPITEVDGNATGFWTYAMKIDEGQGFGSG